MAKLTKGEIAGVRLIADLFVVNELIKNVLSEHMTEEQLQGLKKHLTKSVPKVYLAEAELQKQIQEVRNIWIEELTADLK